MLHNKKNILAIVLGIFSVTVLADVMTESVMTVPMYLTTQEGKGAFVGSVVMEQTSYGLLIAPQLKNLTPGLHGFHVHDMPQCQHMGMEAAGHFDPNHTGKHLGPYRADGHLGDLPALYVNDEGLAVLPVLAPRLTLKDLYGHSLMIHAGGDNYLDYPRELGGGGARVACGTIQKP